MSNLELVLEASTTEISKQSKPKNFPENKIVAKKGGDVAKAARLKLENTTGKNVVSSQNAESLANPNNNKELKQ